MCDANHVRVFRPRAFHNVADLRRFNRPPEHDADFEVLGFRPDKEIASRRPAVVRLAVLDPLLAVKALVVGHSRILLVDLLSSVQSVRHTTSPDTADTEREAMTQTADALLVRYGGGQRW